MIKRMSLLTRRPDVTPEQFLEHWRGIHADLLRKLMPECRGYVQNLWLGPGPDPLRPPGPHRIDGIVELWFESLPALESAFGSERGRELMEDGRLFIETVTTFVVEERVIIAGPRGAAKFMAAFERRQHLAPDEFTRMWRDEHPAHVMRGVPKAVRYVQNQVVDSRHRHLLASGGGTPVDGFVEISWATQEDMATDLAGPTIGAMRTDADRFIEVISGSQVGEQVVIDRLDQQ